MPPAYPVRPSSQSPGSRPQRSLFRQERTASCKTAALRERSSDVWCYRWGEVGPTGRRKHRRIVLGTVEHLHDKRAANQATVGLRREINSHDIRTKTTLMTVAELADHFRERELLDSNMRITYSTKKAYAGYLTKWIVPRWGQNALQHIKAREGEWWLASVHRARATRAKI